MKSKASRKASQEKIIKAVTRAIDRIFSVRDALERCDDALENDVIVIEKTLHRLKSPSKGSK